MVTQLKLERPYTAADLAEIDDDRNRYEIIGGELIVSPSPTESHQWASGNLFALVRQHVMDNRIGLAYAAPFDVYLSEHDVVEPDIVVVLKEHRDRVHQHGIVGPPDLLVEIVSPSSFRVDRVRKAATYATFGVPEYWIADPDARSILALTLVGQHYEPIPSDDGLIHSRAVPGLVIDPPEVFAVPEWMAPGA